MEVQFKVLKSYDVMLCARKVYVKVLRSELKMIYLVKNFDMKTKNKKKNAEAIIDRT